MFEKQTKQVLDCIGSSWDIFFFQQGNNENIGPLFQWTLHPSRGQKKQDNTKSKKKQKQQQQQNN